MSVTTKVEGSSLVPNEPKDSEGIDKYEASHQRVIGYAQQDLGKLQMIGWLV
jgi:hypothetical protein